MPDAKASAFVGSIPELYDRHMGPVFIDPYAADLAQRIDPAGLPLLELASGTGRLSVPLLDRLQGRSFVALDLNLGMQQIARGAVPPNRVYQVTGDAMALPFADRSFAQAACQFGVMFFPDKARAAAEVRRVLEPGAPFVFNFWGPLSENPLPALGREVISRFFPGGPPEFFNTPFGYWDFDVIRGDLRAGGFDRIDFVRVNLVGRCDSARHLAIGMTQGSPLSMALKERSTTPIQALTDAVGAELERQFGPGPFDVPMLAYVDYAWG